MKTTITHKLIESALFEDVENCFGYFDASMRAKTVPVLFEASKDISSAIVFEAQNTEPTSTLQEKLYNGFPPQTQKAIDFVIESVAEFGPDNFTDIIEDAESRFAIVDGSLKEYFGQAITAKLYESGDTPTTKQRTHIDDIKDYIAGKDPKVMSGKEAKDFIDKNFGPRPKRKVLKVRGGRIKW